MSYKLNTLSALRPRQSREAIRHVCAVPLTPMIPTVSVINSLARVNPFRDHAESSVSNRAHSNSGPR